MINYSVLMGRLTADPVLKSTPGGISVVSFTLAANRSYGKDGQQKADFIDCVAWRQTAEFICKYFSRGSLMAVEGSLQSRMFDDREGNKRKATEIIVRQAHFAESKKETSGEPKKEQAASMGLTYSHGSDEDFMAMPDDDDLPF